MEFNNFTDKLCLVKAFILDGYKVELGLSDPNRDIVNILVPGGTGTRHVVDILLFD